MNPVLVNAWRGNAIETRHRGAVSVVEVSGRSLLSLGDVQQNTFPRSSIKFLQAIPLVESGALDAFGLGDEHIALSCASHNGEAAHVERVNDWLTKIGCHQDHLECGATLPMHQETSFELMGQGDGPTRAHHNCSGKHVGLLTTCMHLNENIANYRLYAHTAQKRWFETLESMSNTRVQQLPWGYDGCGIPCIAVPLHRIALAMARFADPSALAASRRQAIERIQSAVSAHPYLVAGKERLCTELMSKLAPGVLVKVGADGCYTACIPSRGIGIALKMDDGQTRASQVALGAVLQALNVLPLEVARELEEYIAPSIINSRGDVVGRAECSSEWEGIAL